MKSNVKFAQPAVAALGLLALLGANAANAADAVMAPELAPAAMPMEEPPLNTWQGPYAFGVFRSATASRALRHQCG